MKIDSTLTNYEIMTKEDALIVLKEYQKSRRGEPPYHCTEDPRISLSCPYPIQIVDEAVSIVSGFAPREESEIVKSCLNWMRSKGIYEDSRIKMPYTAERFGQAIDVMIEEMSKHFENED